MADTNNKQFAVENALGMYAYSWAVLPAKSIYRQKDFSHLLHGVPEKSHIYLIGETPRIHLGPFGLDESTLTVALRMLGTEKCLEFPTIPGSMLKEENGYFFLQDDTGRRYFPPVEQILLAAGGVPFKILYVGQAFGKNGERKALDRLVSHSRLQEIALNGPEDGHELSILLFELAENMVISQFNPFAEKKGEDVDKQRIGAGVDKLFGTSLAERISLYEAALIRYFRPKYNVEFKKSFPSTNQKILQDCYDKDFAAVVAEICIDEFPYLLFSDEIEPKHFHIAQFPLHKGKERDFFFLDSLA